MGIRQKQRVPTDTWRSLECRTTHSNTRAKESKQLNHGWPNNRQKKLRPQPTKIHSFKVCRGHHRVTGVQLKREAKLSNMIKHADCRIMFMLYPILFRKISPTYSFVNLYASVVVPCCCLFLLSVFISWFSSIMLVTYFVNFS